MRPWHFEATDVNQYYTSVCNTLMTEGIETSPRGQRTKELHPTTAFIEDPRRRIVSCYGRVINLPFALVEVIQLITGQNDAQALKFYNSKIIEIQGDSPDAFRFNAAYGERLRRYYVGANLSQTGVAIDQLEHVIQTLKNDHDSRQASIVLSHPGDDNYTVQTKDRACNVYAHAMIRDNKLDWMQIIRSNDAVWGIPYNMMQWSHVQEWVAASLDIQVGSMFIVQDSFHVYEDKYDECSAVEHFDMYQYQEIVPLRMEASRMVSDEIHIAERNVRMGMEYDTKAFRLLEDSVGPYWRTVIAALQSYRQFKRGHDEEALRLLPEYSELRLPMMRNFCYWRWGRNTKYEDLVKAVALELSSYGIPDMEIVKWLGIE